MHYILDCYYGKDHNGVEGDQNELVAIFKNEADADGFAVGGFVIQTSNREDVLKLVTVHNDLYNLLALQASGNGSTT